MRHTPNIEKAIRRAAQLHHGQTRRGELDLPYVTHLFAVAAMISEHTDDEEVIIAGLLHDTLEDTEYTQEELAEEFGVRVKELVLGVTIPEKLDKDKPKSEWSESRRGYIENLKTAPAESALVAAADKTHNFESILHEYGGDPKRYAEDFRGTYDDRVRVYGTIVDVLVERLGNEHPLSKRLREAFAGYQNLLKSAYGNI